MEVKMNNSFRQTKIGIGCSAAVIAILVILFTPVYVVAAEKPIEIKLVTLAPIGTSPHVSLLKMGEKWQKASGGKVKLTVIGSYRAGGEGAIVDKMAIGGIDAALMTVVGLSAVNPDIDALSSIPMVYDSLEELDYVVSKLGPEFASRLEQKGYILLFWSDIGWVRRFSVQPLETGREIKADGRKESEDAVAAMIKKQRLVVTNPTPQINEEWRRWVRSAYPRVRGSIVPADAFDKVEPLLREYRLNRQLGKR